MKIFLNQLSTFIFNQAHYFIRLFYRKFSVLYFNPIMFFDFSQFLGYPQKTKKNSDFRIVFSIWRLMPISEAGENIFH